MLSPLRLLKSIGRHSRNLITCRKKQRDYEQGICLRGRYYFHQILDLGEEKGCALTALAMLFSNYKKKKITPVQVYRWNLNNCRIYWDVVFLRAGLKWGEELLYAQTSTQKLAAVQDLLAQHPEGAIGEFIDASRGFTSQHYLLFEKAADLVPEMVSCADPMGRGDDFRGAMPLPETYAWQKFGGADSLGHLNRLIYVQHTTYKLVLKKGLRYRLRFLKYCLPLTLRTKFLIYKYTHHWPDTEHPATYIDKLLAYMWSDCVAGYAPYADKIAVRAYVARTVGAQYLTKFYGQYDSLRQVDFTKLPARFYVKTNHGCGWNLFCADKEDFCQHLPEKEQQMQSWLKDNIWHRNGERQYQGIEPAIFVEEYLPLVWPQNTMLRFFCFGGRVEYINVTKDFSGEECSTINQWYDVDWQPQPCLMYYPGQDFPIKKPDNLAELLTVAAKLAAPFPFVRVDLYDLGGKRIVFSELTFTPGSDMGPVLSPAWNRKLGQLFPEKDTWR